MLFENNMMSDELLPQILRGLLHALPQHPSSTPPKPPSPFLSFSTLSNGLVILYFYYWLQPVNTSFGNFSFPKLEVK